MLKFCRFLDPTWPSKSNKNRRFESQVRLRWAKLGVCWGYVGLCWPNLAHLEAILSDLAAMLGQHGANMGQHGTNMTHRTPKRPKKPFNINLTGQGTGSAVFFIAVPGSALFLQAAASISKQWFSYGFHMSFSQWFTRIHKDQQGLTRIHKDSRGFARTHKDSQGPTRTHKDIRIHKD